MLLFIEQKRFKETKVSAPLGMNKGGIAQMLQIISPPYTGTENGRDDDRKSSLETDKAKRPEDGDDCDEEDMCL
jgi:hypothetical protein